MSRNLSAMDSALSLSMAGSGMDSNDLAMADDGENSDCDGSIHEDGNRNVFYTVGDMLAVSQSQSTFRKKWQAKRLLQEEARKQNMLDSEKVTPESSRLVINVLYKYSGLANAKEAKGLKTRDSVNGIAAGLRTLYMEAGHRSHFSVQNFEDGRVIATGNPMEGNDEVRLFRATHRKRAAELGQISRPAPALTEHHVLEHAIKFWLNENNFDRRDVAFHTIMLTAMNCGLRYGEITKLKMSDVTCIRGKVSFCIREKTKNSCSFKEYRLRPWPGKHFKGVLVMDPLVALSTWLEIRGDAPGFLFCNIAGNGIGQRLVPHEEWSRKHFVNFMRTRFEQLGFAQGKAMTHSGHSAKRGGVQLLRALGVKDMAIMQFFKMVGRKAYLRYTEGFNDAAPGPPPDFASYTDMIAHVQGHYSNVHEYSEKETSEIIEAWINSG